jgi:hypothetical protein
VVSALCDFFVALVLLSLAAAVFFGAFAWATWHASPLAAWQITTLRGALASTGALVIGTGLAAGWEMSRAKPRLAIHRDWQPVDPNRCNPPPSPDPIDNAPTPIQSFAGGETSGRSDLE